VGTLVRPGQEARQDGRGEYVPKHLDVVRSHHAHSLLLRSLRPRPSAPVGALVRPGQEAGEDGGGEHLPKDLPVVRPHLPRLLSLPSVGSRFLLQPQRSGGSPSSCRPRSPSRRSWTAGA
jgi:hypothetical protein